MTLLLDTSVVLKWFHADGEAEVAEARALLHAHRDGRDTTPAGPQQPKPSTVPW